MKQFVTAGAALLLTTSIATAGGLDRSGQSVGVIFEDGDYAELSFGSVTPSVTGVAQAALGGTNSGEMANSYTQFGLAYKTQLSDQLALGIIFDNPYGADVTYDTAGYIFNGANAQVESDAVTALLNYNINDNFSVHGGLRYLKANGVYTVPALPAALGGSPAYSSTYSSGDGVGFVAGAAYERKDIALRVALTYSSEIELSTLEGTVGDLDTTLPESINLDFQTGIAADTLLFGSIRYVAWDGFALTDSLAGDILTYDDDVVTYNVGVGRRLTDQLAASFSIGYENSTGDPTGNLGPTDGYISYQVGAAYTMDSGVEVSGGVRYVNIGDATTTIGSAFNDNSAIGVGLKVAYSF
ncbi:transporter [Octadecabacter sp. CECT 8868]|uniref:OmpP1/FadL family transporter n=1 Tax=Octadecabacter algicola TaxID=2909342 RepID=UPI001F1D5414|nr:transporter [Octadecabacter algicola]MCF2903926.1 transporter [Octadecabacter algicola]